MKKSLKPAIIGAVSAFVIAAPVQPMLIGAQAAEEVSTAWRVDEPKGEPRRLTFTTTEGTWMSLSVSPDGETIVFDLLGDLYVLPRAGGQARPITRGGAWDIEPRFAPDGARIAFISDRGGAQNIWTVNPDGTDLRQVSKEPYEGLSSPVWAPDGASLIARQKLSRGSYNYKGPWQILRYRIADGAKTVLISGERDLAYKQLGRFQVAGLAPSGPSVSPDGGVLYLAGQVGKLQVGGRAHPATQILSLALGGDAQFEQLTEGYNGAFRPEPSPDGTLLAFGRREGGGTNLWLRDLETGEERRLVSGITRDALGSRMMNDLLPGYGWTSDSKALVIAKDGFIVEVDVASGATRRIPFVADVDLTLSEQVKPRWRIDDRPFGPKVLRWHRRSPDGTRLAFQALGRIWIADPATGRSELLTGGSIAPSAFDPDAVFEYAPAWSPDGTSIAFTTWHKLEGGHVWVMPLVGGAPRRLTKEPGVYSNPAFSPDGRILVYSAVAEEDFQPGRMLDTTPVAVRLAPLDGSSEKTLFELKGAMAAPEFSADGARVYFVAPMGTAGRRLISVDLDGGDPRGHLALDWLERAAVSPDGARVALQVHDAIYVADMPQAGEDGTRPKTLLSDVRRLTRSGAHSVAWADESTVVWGYANRFFAADLDAAEAEPASVAIKLKAPRNNPRGTVAFIGARIVTMAGERGDVIERGDIVVRNNRIRAVGPSGSVRIPSKATRIDVTGATIVPGFVDIHAHPIYGWTSEILPQQSRGLLSDLAYGVTTVQDPASVTAPSFALAELIETGQVLGPRYLGAGSQVTGFQSAHNEWIDSYETALAVVRRRRALGTNTIKEYGQPHRVARQWLVEAARETGLGVVFEGTGGLYLALTAAVDGATGHEHSFAYAPLRKDAITLFAFSGMAYDPVLVGPRTGAGGFLYHRKRMDELTDEKQLAYIDRAYRAFVVRRLKNVVIPEHDFVDGFLAQGADAVQIARAGGLVTAGSHSDGLMFHLEIWSFVLAGMTPIEALRTATLSGAEAIGVEADLGSIERGKFADFVVLNANPLANIENTRDIRFVVKNGRVYDDDTLDQVWPEPLSRPRSFWLKNVSEGE